MEKPHFLESYKVHEKPEAQRAARKKERLTGEAGIFAERGKRIQAYLDRLEHIFLHPDPKTRERNIDLVKPLIFKNTIIKKENFPESYFEFQKKLAKDQGMGEVSFTKEQKEEEIGKVQDGQRKSLEAWIDYLSSDDSKYPTDIKFFAMQGALKLGNFDTTKYAFSDREKATTAPFAEIDREALSIVLGALEAKYHEKDLSGYSPQLLELIDQKKSFGAMYAEAMRELDTRASKEELLSLAEGEWRVFKQGSDPRALVNSLAGKRSNLCLADIGSASRYLETGDIEVFFSYNRAKEPFLPRIAIAVNEEKGGVYEVRGTYNKNEDLDPFISATDTLAKRLKTVPNGEKFMAADKDMKRMTAIYNKCFKEDKKTKEKIYLNPELTRADLIFLYEIDQPIEGFGYQRDPRIKEIRDQRNTEEDMLIVFECSQDQIAKNANEIDENTKAYLGTWSVEIFQKIRNYPKVKHLYESFPDKKIFMRELETDPRVSSPALAEEALQRNNIALTDWGKDILYKTEFSQEAQEYNLVRFTVEQLGFPNGATTDEIYRKAESLGLELCPAEVGPHLRLQYSGKEWMLIAMNQITDRGGNPNVFSLFSGGAQLRLNGRSAEPGERWHPRIEWVFSAREFET